MKQSVTILPLEAIPREPSGSLASLACRGVRGAVFQLCHRRRAWMRLLLASPPALLGSGGRGPAGASRAGAQRHQETGRATTKVQPLPPACERIRGPARRVEAGRRPGAPSPRRRRGRASSSSAVPSLPPLSASAPQHIHVPASLPPSSLLHQIFRDINKD
jgi:hypothetical protein